MRSVCRMAKACSKRGNDMRKLMRHYLIPMAAVLSCLGPLAPQAAAQQLITRDIEGQGHRCSLTTLRTQ